MTGPLTRRLVAGAVGLAVVGDFLVNEGSLRLGFTLWVLLVVGFAYWIGREGAAAGSAGDRDREILLLVVGLLGLGYIFRDSEFLQVINTFGGLIAASLIVWRARGRRLSALHLGDGFVAAVSAGLAVGTGGLRLVFGDGLWGDTTEPTRRRAGFAIVGALATVPLLAITMTLLGEADPLFGSVVEALGTFITQDLFAHLVIVAFVSWTVAGWMRGGLVADFPGADERLPFVSKVPMAGLAPAIYAMIVLLSAFLGLQARTLFGGAAFVERTMGLSYAEYARGGFFSLVAVTILLLVVLLIADFLLDRGDGVSERRFRSASWILVVLVGILGASAVHRLWLYVSTFGLTEDRFFAAAAIVGIVAVLAWFSYSVLGGRRERFMVGVAVIAVVWVAALNIIAPDAVVARVNLERAREGKTFDAVYHGTLSADALPILVRGAPTLPAAHCIALRDALRRRVVSEETRWQDWSLPAARTRAVLARGAAIDNAGFCPQP
jgi:hypothetical protein